MSDLFIPSLTNAQEGLCIKSLPSADIGFMTVTANGCDLALARTDINSIYSTVKDWHLQPILAGMKTNFSERPPKNNIAPLFKQNEKMNIVSYSCDHKDVYVSAIETKDNLIGIQTWRHDWQEFRDNVPVIWLGYADDMCKANKSLRLFYNGSRYSIFPRWENDNGGGKYAQRDILTLDQIQHPVLKI